MAALRTDSLRSRAVAEELSTLTPFDAVDLLGQLLRQRRDSPSAAACVDAVTRALAKGELSEDFVEALQTLARSRADRLVEALLASGPAVRTYDKNEEAFVDRRLRALTLGERRAMSRSRNIDLLVRLAHDQDIRVVQGLLQNPRITEREAVMIASRRPTHATVLEQVLASKFGQYRRVRRAVAHNPYSPVALAARAMATLTVPELEEIASDDKIAEDVRQHARTLIVGRTATPAERTRQVRNAAASDENLEAWLEHAASERSLAPEDLDIEFLDDAEDD